MEKIPSPGSLFIFLGLATGWPLAISANSEFYRAGERGGGVSALSFFGFLPCFFSSVGSCFPSFFSLSLGLVVLPPCLRLLFLLRFSRPVLWLFVLPPCLPPAAFCFPVPVVLCPVGLCRLVPGGCVGWAFWSSCLRGVALAAPFSFCPLFGFHYVFSPYFRFCLLSRCWCWCCLLCP